MHYVYVLTNSKGSFYVGYTAHLRRRLAEHQEGLGGFTRGKERKLVYYEAYASGSDARRREAALKQSSQARRWLRERTRDSKARVLEELSAGEALNRSPSKRRP